MSEIIPNGTVIFYSGVKMDPNYQNTLRWLTYEAQQNFFLNTLPRLATVERISYQRVTRGVIRVQLGISVLNTCNYMAFVNTDLNNKWFYAFVTRTEYVNNTTTDIFYELDYIQTYYFQASFGPCFVEREHVANDTVGAHTLPEPVRINSNIAPTLIQNINVGDCAIVCAKVDIEEDQEFAAAEKVGNLVNPIKFYIFNSGYNDRTVGATVYKGFHTLTGLLMTQAWANAESEVVSFFMFPFNLLGAPTDSGSNSLTRDVLSTDVNIPRPTNLHGYVPRNNKLFTYPFSYVTVDNGDAVNQYRWEWFRNTAVQFRYIGALCCNPEVYLMPIAYNNSDGNAAPCWAEKSVINNFPQIPFAVDSYRAWLAQTQSTRKNKLISGIATGAVGGGSTGAAAGPIGAAVGAFIGGVGGAITAGINNSIADAEARDQANKWSGASTGNTEIATGNLAFRVNHMCLTAEQAKVIDDFFSMYGYQVNEVKAPSIHTRARWNYLKTNGLNVIGSVPAECYDALRRIHEHGITYWENHAEIGNYALSNPPV